MAREIELKFKLSNEQKEYFIDWISSNCKLEAETHQLEYYFDNPSQSTIYDNEAGFKDSTHYLRVRFDKDKGESICLKIFEQKGFVSKNIDEIEFDVSSGKEAVKLFNALGYSYKIEIDKKRKIYISQDKRFEICLDEVKGLGFFVEIELKAQIEGDIKFGFKQIYDFIREIGLNEIDVQSRGYVSMFWNPNVDFGRKKKLV